jgi:hypothetical protein
MTKVQPPAKTSAPEAALDHSLKEDRFILLGFSAKPRLVCHAYRASDEVIRIISARKATPNEHKQYGSFLRERIMTSPIVVRGNDRARHGDFPRRIRGRWLIIGRPGDKNAQDHRRGIHES